MYGIETTEDVGKFQDSVRAALKEFNEESTTEATHVWLHPDWLPLEAEFQAVLGLGMTLVFDPAKSKRGYYEVGMLEDAQPIVRGDGMWEAKQARSPGVGDIVLAAHATVTEFINKYKLMPTHLSVHKSFYENPEVSEKIETDTNLTIDREGMVMSYPQHLAVGIPEAVQKKVEAESSTVQDIHYFPDEPESDPDGEGALFITFLRRRGAPAPYCYYGVPQNVYMDLLKADSKGGFVTNNIRGKYEFDKLDPIAEPEEEQEETPTVPAPPTLK